MNGSNRMERRQFLKYAAVFGFAGATVFSGSKMSGKSARKPNILMIVVDDLRIQLGCYGHKETISPNIDRIAAEGTVFKRAYCQVPVCGASRASFLTGLRPTAARFKSAGTRADADVPSADTIPEHFKSNGYYTIGNGKIFHEFHDSANGWDESWRSVPIYHGPGDWAGYNTNKLWQDADSADKINPKTGRGPYYDCADVPDDAYQDGKLAQKTISDLRRLKKMDTPFFLACGFWRPHLPFNAPKKYWDLYDRESIKVADNIYKPANLPSSCKGSGEINSYGLVEGRSKETNIDFHREARHAYYACVSYVDAQIGKIMDELDALGLADNTIIVLWGDHGWHLGEHTFWGKHNTLNNALQAPLLVRAPGLKKNNRTNALVEFVDVYPTLCELTGVPEPTTHTLAGKSFVPLMSNPDLAWKQAVFSRWNDGKAVKTDRFLYTQWRNNHMLYDHLGDETHAPDPAENKNVADDAYYASHVSRLRELLKTVP